MTTENEANTERLIEALDSFNVLMLNTFDETGLVRSRPMSKAGVDDDGKLWFVASSKGDVTDQIGKIHQVSLTGQSTMLFLSIQATAEVYRDTEKAKELWAESMRLWFPDGPSQSDLVLIGVEPKSAEVWDNRGTKGLKFAFNAVKAWWSGKSIEKFENGEARETLSL